MLFKSNILYIIERLLKRKDIKWSCYVDLKVWAKSYDERKIEIKKTNIIQIKHSLYHCKALET